MFVGAPAGYRPPATVNLARIASSSAISSSVSSTIVEFSLTLAAVVAPGMGMISGMPGRRAMPSTQPMASCAGVQPFLAAKVSSCRTISRLTLKFSGWKRGKWRRMSPSGMSSGDLNWPVRI